jgi:cathepsin F
LFFSFSLKFYFRGVAHPHRIFCNPQGLNHGVLLVGYGIEQKSKIFFLS